MGRILFCACFSDFGTTSSEDSYVYPAGPRNRCSLHTINVWWQLQYLRLWRSYQLVFQNRVSPDGLVVIDGSDTQSGEYWVQPNEKLIRPYGICMRPVCDLWYKLELVRDHCVVCALDVVMHVNCEIYNWFQKVEGGEREWRRETGGNWWFCQFLYATVATYVFTGVLYTLQEYKSKSKWIALAWTH